jgi:rhodanese-related sulfurtransferase
VTVPVKSSRLGLAAAAIALAGGIVPLALYWLLFGRVPTILPEEAKELLRRPKEAAVLADVRPKEAYAAGHLDGSVSWPLSDILALGGPGELPREFQGRRVLLVCDVGWQSAQAARHLERIGVAGAASVRGGIQEWIRSAAVAAGRTRPPPESVEELLRPASPPQGGRFDRFETGTGRIVEFPFRNSPVGQQAAAVLAFFVIKPIYTILAALAVVILWRSRAPDLAALRWAMISFFIGENACAVNYLVFRETSYFVEYLHSYGMLLCFGFTAYAVLEGIDRRLLGTSDLTRRCAAVALCGGCVKQGPSPCGLRRVFYLVIPALIALALMLPTADWQQSSYNTAVFGQLYNYGHLQLYQYFENWYCAAAAITMFAASLAILCLKRDKAIGPAKVALAAGLGPLGFGMLRMVLGGAYDHNRVWYLFWEEGTELLFILSVLAMVWIFRRGLLDLDSPAGHGVDLPAVHTH